MATSIVFCNSHSPILPTSRITSRSRSRSRSGIRIRIPPPLQIQFPLNSSPSLKSPSLRFFCPDTTRGSSLLSRAAPGTSTYVFAVVMPLSLIIATVFTSIRIADKLDRDFLEEIAVDQSILEADEEDGDVGMPLEKKSPLPRRNRPKREAETSSL